jgi:hypothetical protein
MEFNPEFRKAIKYYRMLLEEGFPQKAILKLIGDKYKLSSNERAMLYRGVCSKEDAIYRKSKLTTAKSMKQKAISIDAYNVFITVGSYLNGNPVFICNDNFLRDSSGVHGKAFRKELFNRALLLVFEYLEALKISEAHFYLDNPVSNSGKHSITIEERIKRSSFSGHSETHRSPNYILKKIDFGNIATSDSTIIEHCQVPVFDLARKTINYHFKPKFINLNRAGQL